MFLAAELNWKVCKLLSTTKTIFQWNKNSFKLRKLEMHSHSCTKDKRNIDRHSKTHYTNEGEVFLKKLCHSATFFTKIRIEILRSCKFLNGWFRAILIGNAFWSFRTTSNGISRHEADALWPSLVRGTRRFWPRSGVTSCVFTRDTIRGRENVSCTRTNVKRSPVNVRNSIGILSFGLLLYEKHCN